MRLTPLDIRKQEFTRGFRGYETEEVHAFLQMVSKQWEDLQDDQRRLEERLRQMESKLEHYEKVEEALQEALQTARESSRRAVENAEQKARMIIEEAEGRAVDIKREAEQDRHQIKREAAKLSGRRNEIVARLRAFLMSEMELLARFEGDDPIGFIKLLPAEERRLHRAGADLSLPPSVEEVNPDLLDAFDVLDEDDAPDTRTQAVPPMRSPWADEEPEEDDEPQAQTPPAPQPRRMDVPRPAPTAPPAAARTRPAPSPSPFQDMDDDGPRLSQHRSQDPFKDPFEEPFEAADTAPFEDPAPAPAPPRPAAQAPSPRPTAPPAPAARPAPPPPRPEPPQAERNPFEDPFSDDQLDEPEAEADDEDEAPPQREEVRYGPGWTARSVISTPSEPAGKREGKPEGRREERSTRGGMAFESLPGADDDDDERNITATSEEIEKIRRILNDLD